MEHESKNIMYEHSAAKVRLLKEYISAYLGILSNADWIKEEQKNTTLNLLDRIKPWNAGLDNDIIIEFDAKQLDQEAFKTITQFPEIIAQSGEIGEFELGIFKISIYAMTTYEHNLVHIYNK